ncbi:MAG: hypothetical protein FJ189_08545, partial [Gammaproteobacteria bacterium]|nr:hypothetical protein [Gammaproteobacteria bacterium]
MAQVPSPSVVRSRSVAPRRRVRMSYSPMSAMPTSTVLDARAAHKCIRETVPLSSAIAHRPGRLKWGALLIQWMYQPMPNRLEIVRVEIRPLDAPLRAPFTIASSRVDTVRNVAIGLHLADGSLGWGEAPTLPPVTTEDQPMALAAARSAADWLPGRDAGAWRAVAAELCERLPDCASVRAGIEMALFDALAREARMPLYRWFGGSGHALVTDITIPICQPDEAERLAAEYRARGFATIKVKIGLDTDED